MNKLITLQELDNNEYFCSFIYDNQNYHIVLDKEIALSLDLEQFYKAVLNKEKKEVDYNDDYNKLIKQIIDSNLFVFKNDCFYRNNEHISMPFLLVNKFYENKDNQKELKKYDNFWYWVTFLNITLRERIFSWLEKGDFEITQEGFLVTYRNVVFKDEDYKPFYDTVKKWKKSPKNYTVKEGKIILKSQDDTSLEELVSNRVFTHNHDAKKRLYYRLGVEASIDRREANYDNKACSSGGLHVLSKENLENCGIDYCGNGYTLACLINPMNIVALPDDNRKIRTIAFYPFEEVYWKEGKIVEAKNTKKASLEYAKMCNFELKDYKNNVDKYPKLMGFNFVDIDRNFREIIFV